MKKFIFRFAAVAAAFLMFSSCSILSRLTANGVATGNTTGSALLSLFNLVQQSRNQSTSSIDLTNTSNLIRLGQILTGASALTNATPTYTSDFSTGLIQGSSNLVNNNNVGGVLSGLLSLANLGNSAFNSAATQAYTTGNAAATQVSTATAGASETLSALGSIFSLLGN